MPTTPRWSGPSSSSSSSSSKSAALTRTNSELLLLHALHEGHDNASHTSNKILQEWKKLQCAESFVPDLVLESVVKGALSSDQPSQSGGVCVVLLADISGFTRLSEELSALGNDGLECLSETLNDYFARMIDVIYAHGGDVMKFAGDALLAVWRQKAVSYTHLTLPTIYSV